MAYATTTLSAAVAVTDTSIIVASATSFAIDNRIIIDGEEMRVTKAYTSGTTIPVLRGQNGTATTAHASGAGVMQGIGAADFPSPAAQQQTVSPNRAANLVTWADITATGTTGTNAAVLPVATQCIATVTGTSGAGVILPSATAMPGARYDLKNCTTGTIKLYATGATINGNAGATGVSLTSTGNIMLSVICTEAGAWNTMGNT